MDSVVSKSVEEVLETPGWEGICVSDLNGLPIMNKGTLKPETATVASHLLQLASRLEPGATSPPVVTLVGDNTNKVIFTSSGDTIVATHVVGNS